MKKLLKNIQQEKALIIRSSLFLLFSVVLIFLVKYYHNNQPVIFDVKDKYEEIGWFLAVTYLVSIVGYVYLYFVMVAKQCNITKIIYDNTVMGAGLIFGFHYKFENPDYNKNDPKSKRFLEANEKGETIFSYQWNYYTSLFVFLISIYLSSIVTSIPFIGAKTIKTYDTKITTYQKKLYGRELYFLTIEGENYEISKEEYNGLISDKIYAVYEKESWLRNFFLIKKD